RSAPPKIALAAWSEMDKQQEDMAQRNRVTLPLLVAPSALFRPDTMTECELERTMLLADRTDRLETGIMYSNVRVPSNDDPKNWVITTKGDVSRTFLTATLELDVTQYLCDPERKANPTYVPKVEKQRLDAKVQFDSAALLSGATNPKHHEKFMRLYGSQVRVAGEFRIDHEATLAQTAKVLSEKRSAASEPDEVL